MQACLTVHVPDQAAIVRMAMPGAPLRIGRGDDSGLRIDHGSVSRAHAELHAAAAGWTLADLGSKNGSFVEGARVAADAPRALPPRAWLRFGDVYCEFAAFDDDQANRAAADRRARRAVATAHTARIDGVRDLGGLLDASLRGVLELAQCERGFVLLAGQDAPGAAPAFAVRASVALDAGRLRGRDFSGSVGAVRRALDTRRSVVANDIPGEAWLAERQSVVAAGLHALVCVPLLDGEHVLGAIYADRTRPGAPLTTLDLELLEAFAERAALWLAAHQAAELLARLPAGDAAGDAPIDWNGVVAAHAAPAR